MSEVNMFRNSRLGDVIDIRDGTHDSPPYVEHGMPLITSKNLTDTGLCFREVNFISENNHKQISKRSTVERGDILYGMIGTIGKPTLVDTDREFSIKNVALFKQSNPLIYNRYLRWLLNSSSINKQIAQASKGGTQKFVSLGALRGLEATFPSLPEQRRIAAILDQADAIRAKRREALVQLDSLTRAIFIEMFGDPVSNPKGWVTRKLREVTTFENGDRSGNYPSGDDIKIEGIPFLSTKNIIDGRLDLNNPAYISTQKFASLSRGKARRYDLIITLRGTLGSCCIFDCSHETGFINAQMMIIRPRAECHHTYLHALISSRHTQERLASLSRGAAVPQLTATQLAEFLIPVPPMSDQIAFAKCKDALDKLKKIQESASKELNSLFSSLQYRAFRGEL